MKQPVTQGATTETGKEAPVSVIRHVLPDYHKAYAVIVHPIAARCENCS